MAFAGIYVYILAMDGSNGFVALIFLVLGLSYLSGRVRRNLQLYFFACTWLITLHYFYLFYENAGEMNWIVGAFVTVMAADTP